MLDLIERNFTVSVPVEAAWEHLAMIEHWHTWASHIKSIKKDTDNPLNAQSKGTIHLKNGIKSTFEMIEFTPHQNWKWIGPFLWMTVHYDHRFRMTADNECEMTFHVAAEGFVVGIFGRLFAIIYNRNLDVAIPNLIKELQASA